MVSLWRHPPAVVAHRGAPREAPENTLASFREALAQGARAIELDVRLTLDGVLVVHHDRELGRTVAGDGLVEETRWSDLATLDAGSWFGPAFVAERAPTLAQTLEALPRDALVNVELKADALNAEALPEAVHRVVAQARALERVLVTSFDGGLADAYAERAATPAGLILPYEPDEADARDWPRLEFVALRHESAHAEALDLLKRAGKTVLAWTVNDESEARALLEAGVEGVITDRPGALLAALRPDASAP